jgi:hypothetical protein
MRYGYVDCADGEPGGAECGVEVRAAFFFVEVEGGGLEVQEDGAVFAAVER